MMRPGRNYINAEIRLTAHFYDDNDTDTNPTTVVCKVLSPTGIACTYTYGTDSNIGRVDVGDYYCDVTPTVSGRWSYRWEATGNATTVANEGTFVVDYSPFYDGMLRDYTR